MLPTTIKDNAKLMLTTMIKDKQNLEKNKYINWRADEWPVGQVG